MTVDKLEIHGGPGTKGGERAKQQRNQPRRTDNELGPLELEAVRIAKQVKRHREWGDGEPTTMLTVDELEIHGGPSTKGGERHQVGAEET